MTPAKLASLHIAAFGPERAWSEAAFGKLLQDPAVILSIEETSFVLGRVTVDEAEILTVATAPASQGRGLATKALESFNALAAETGALSIFLEVAFDNAPALALYNRAGFKQVGERKNYYRKTDAPAVTALILHKDLP